jgi:transposase-like protein
MAERLSTEVTEKATRRKFSAEEKARILREAAACTAPGELGALMRREGIYSSQLSKWRQQARRGAAKGLAPKKRGPEARVVDARDKQIAELERKLARQTKRAERAEAIVEVQKKVSQLLGIVLPTIDEPNS